MSYVSLHRLKDGPVKTAGRLKSGRLTNAHGDVGLSGMEQVEDGALVSLEGHFHAGTISVSRFEVHGQGIDLSSWTTAFGLRAQLNSAIRGYMEVNDFLEVETPIWIPEPGTDVFLDPVQAAFCPDPGEESSSGYLHTSPEFLMKELLVAGHERIFQIARVFRNGEVSASHNPEFTILEFYRAWEGVHTIMDDVENIVCLLLPELPRPFQRMTMQEVFLEACGIDILECDSATLLGQAVQGGDLLLGRGPDDTWEDLFFELVVEYVDPFLATFESIFVVDWPTQLAVLSEVCPHDARVAQRFELYLGGLELCNGFQELCDPHEQRIRFERDLEERKRRGYPLPPMPERFLNALSKGLPPSCGVAIGLDRLLMKVMDAKNIDQVLAFSGGPAGLKDR